MSADGMRLTILATRIEELEATVKGLRDVMNMASGKRGTEATGKHPVAPAQ